MSTPWQPKNGEEACKRNAGRKKLHMRLRKARADRIVRLLAAIEIAPELRRSAYGWLSVTAETIRMSKATASRDFALARGIHGEFARMFGRKFDAKTDQVLWSWNWSHYGFRTRESYRAGYRKAVGKFPIDTRALPSEEAFCGLGPTSWTTTAEYFAGMSTRDLIRCLKVLK